MVLKQLGPVYFPLLCVVVVAVRLRGQKFVAQNKWLLKLITRVVLRKLFENFTSLHSDWE